MFDYYFLWNCVSPMGFLASNSTFQLIKEINEKLLGQVVVLLLLCCHHPLPLPLFVLLLLPATGAPGELMQAAVVCCPALLPFCLAAAMLGL